jgi:hypothetical protein
MPRVDLVALQQRLAQQRPPTVPAPKVRPATASAAAPAGTLRATTTMRAALPLKATNARAERVEERARANALRAQIDELNAEMVAARAEADRVLAEERQRAGLLSERVEALSAEVLRAEEKQTEAVVGQAERAEAGRDAERARAEALRTSIDELKAGQARVAEMHARELAVAQHDALAAQQAAVELRLAEEARKARGRWARLRAAWRGE